MLSAPPVARRALVEWSLRLQDASNEKIKEDLGWRPQYESWQRGFFEDVAAVTPGGVANWCTAVRARRPSERDVRTTAGGDRRWTKRTQGSSGGGRPSSRPRRSPSPQVNVPSKSCPTGAWW